MLIDFGIIRKEKRLSLRQLEYKSKVPKSMISKIENGQIIPRMDTVCKLAKAMTMPPDELFSILMRNEPWAV